MFDTYVSSVFLYNACLWVLPKAQEEKIDSFQRRLIRTNVLCVRWPQIVKNEEVYEKTSIKPWSKRIKKQRMTWLGHLHRMDESIPAKRAFQYAQQQFRAPRGRPRLTWKRMMEIQLEEDFGMTWEEAQSKSRNRNEWRTSVFNKYG